MLMFVTSSAHLKHVLHFIKYHIPHRLEDMQWHFEIQNIFVLLHASENGYIYRLEDSHMIIIDK